MSSDAGDSTMPPKPAAIAPDQQTHTLDDMPAELKARMIAALERERDKKRMTMLAMYAQHRAAMARSARRVSGRSCMATPRPMRSASASSRPCLRCPRIPYQTSRPRSA